MKQLAITSILNFKLNSIMRSIIKFGFMLGCLILTLSATAQYKTLVLNYEKSSFGENEPLPARSYFIITGVAGSNVPYVDLTIYPAKGDEDKAPVYETFWKKEMNSESLKFTIPVNHKLREGKEYDLLIRYYRATNQAEKDSLQRTLYQTLAAYIAQSYSITKDKISFRKSPKKVVNDLNAIVESGFSKYRSRMDFDFDGFSDVVKFKMEQIHNKTISNALERKNHFEQLTKMLHTEVDQYLSRELYIMIDDKRISDYPTEKIQNFLPVNIGYGGGIVDSDPDNFNYVDGMYVGLSFPFGKEGGKSKFLSRTSFSLGVMTSSEIEDEQGNMYTGPIFKVPVYAALGYRAFQFMRINVGATVLEDVSQSSVKVYPFVGISAELNLSLRLAKD